MTFGCLSLTISPSVHQSVSPLSPSVRQSVSPSVCQSISPSVFVDDLWLHVLDHETGEDRHNHFVIDFRDVFWERVNAGADLTRHGDRIFRVFHPFLGEEMKQI